MSIVSSVRARIYPTLVAALTPLNWVLAYVLARRYRPASVLHISYAGHVPADTVHILRTAGIEADYLAVAGGAAPVASDYQLIPSHWPFIAVLQEFWMVWAVVSKYQIIHSHFMVTATRTGWELPFLKHMGRKIVVHYRGCEIREREQNMRLHPDVNICQDCDYHPHPCTAEYNRRRRRQSARYGDAFLATTPDLKDFAPGATHMPLFAPLRPALRSPRTVDAVRRFKVVHVTNHPGIEGTLHIRRAIEALSDKGHAIEFVELRGVSNERVLAELADADLAIGKLKMGYYANAQIESMASGVPTITYVRPDLLTDDVRHSGFIFATIDSLQSVIEYYITHPAALEERARTARRSILAVHDNVQIAAQYRALYERLEQEEVVDVRDRRRV
jgi:glycosyl transferase family 1